MDQRKKMKGIIPKTDFKHIAKVLFPKALQVYVGCGAEPTTHRNFTELIRLAKEYNVKDTGVVTNGQLLTESQISDLINLQLNELTISCHGVFKTTYEHFMTNSKYDRFISTLEIINRLKAEKQSNFPKIRINYTVNNKNLNELINFFSVFEKYNISTIQIRPVLNIGGKYSNAITEEQIPAYNNIINHLKTECSNKRVRLLANIHDIKFKKKNNDSKVADAVYCYIGPQTNEKLDIEWDRTNFKEFTKKTGWRKKIIAFIFNYRKSSLNKSAVNYEIFD